VHADEHGARRFGDVQQQVEHFPRPRRVQVRRRFVGEDEPGVLDEQPGEGDALTLAARQLVGAAPDRVGDAELSEGVLGAADVIGAGPQQRSQCVPRGPGAEPPGVHVVGDAQ